jgi:hypothetical protein
LNVRLKARTAARRFLEGLEALDPEDLFLDDAEEALDAAVGLGLVVVGRRASDAEVIDFGLVVVAAKAGPPS